MERVRLRDGARSPRPHHPVRDAISKPKPDQLLAIHSALPASQTTHLQFQQLRLAAADFDFAAVDQAGDEAWLDVGLQFDDGVQADDVGAADAEEVGGVDALLDAAE